MKKLFIIIVSVITVIILSFTIYLYIHRINQYDYQQIMVANTDENQNMFNNFNMRDTMSYSEYSEFCQKYGLNQKYNNQNCNYVVYAYNFCGMSFLNVSDIYEIKNHVIICSKESNWGATGDITARVVIIPTTNTYAKDNIIIKNNFKPANYN